MLVSPPGFHHRRSAALGGLDSGHDTQEERVEEDRVAGEDHDSDVHILVLRGMSYTPLGWDCFRDQGIYPSATIFKATSSGNMTTTGNLQSSQGEPSRFLSQQIE